MVEAKQLQKSFSSCVWPVAPCGITHPLSDPWRTQKTSGANGPSSVLTTSTDCKSSHVTLSTSWSGREHETPVSVTSTTYRLSGMTGVLLSLTQFLEERFGVKDI